MLVSFDIVELQQHLHLVSRLEQTKHTWAQFHLDLGHWTQDRRPRLIVPRHLLLLFLLSSVACGLMWPSPVSPLSIFYPPP
jgi:hypothetical protein